MKKSLIPLILMLSFIGIVSAIEFEARTGNANTDYDYVFNFTTSSDCTGVLLSYSESITTDSNGNYFFDIDTSSLSTIPSYLCEYRDGSLRKTHTLSDIIFRSIMAQNITVSDANITDDLSFHGEIMPEGVVCSNGEILKKTSSDTWACGEDQTGAGLSYDFNFTTDSGSEVITDSEIAVFKVNGTGAVRTYVSGNNITFEVQDTYNTSADFWAIAGNGTLMPYSAWNSTNTSYATLDYLNSNFFNNLSNFTDTLTDGKLCFYNATTGNLDCSYTDQTGSGGGNTTEEMQDAVASALDSNFTYVDASDLITVNGSSLSSYLRTGFLDAVYHPLWDYDFADLINVMITNSLISANAINTTQIIDGTISDVDLNLTNFTISDLTNDANYITNGTMNKTVACSDIIGSPDSDFCTDDTGSSTFDLNISSENGNGVITDSEIFNIIGNGSANVVTYFDGQNLTIQATDTDTDTFNTTEDIWAIAGNGTLMFASNWNATNTSYPTLDYVDGKFYYSLANFTDTLTDGKICIYNSTQGKIDCEYTDQTGTGDANQTISYIASTDNVTLSGGGGSFLIVDNDTQYTNGSGISLVGTQFNHSDTSSQSSSDNSGNTFIQDITLDTYGHLTALVTSAVDFTGYALISNLVSYVGNFSAENSTIARVGDCPAGQVVQNTTNSGVECVTPTAVETDPFWSGNFSDFLTHIDINDYFNNATATFRTLTNVTFTSQILANAGLRLGAELNANSNNITAVQWIHTEKVNFTANGNVTYYANGCVEEALSSGGIDLYCT